MPRDLYQWFNGETQLERVNLQHKESKTEVWAWQRSRLMFEHFYRICTDADALLSEEGRWSEFRKHLSWLSEEE